MEAREARNGGFDEDVFILDFDVDNEATLLILLIKIEDSRQRRLPSAQMCPFTMLLYLTDCCLKL